MKNIVNISALLSVLLPGIALAKGDDSLVAGMVASSFGMVIVLAVIVFMFFVMWKLFEKMGRKGWEGIIPIYNIVVLLQLLGLSPWLALLFVVPFVNYIFGIYVMYRLALSFGKGIGFTIGLVFLQAIFLAILAFGGARYLGPNPAAASTVPPMNPPVPPQDQNTPNL